MISRRRALAAPWLALGLALLAPIGLCADDPRKPDDKKADEAKVEGDLKKMQGEWISKDDQGEESTWKFTGDRLSLKTPTRQYEITVTLDEKARPHRSMDMKVSEDSPNAKGVNGLAIYKFDGDDRMTVCFSAAGPRPSEFKTEEFTQFSMDLKRKGK